MRLAGAGPEVAEPAGMTALVTVGGKYRLDAELGEGGMGVVWRAFNVKLEMPVAIKLLQPGHSPEFAERLRTEARAAAQLIHPGIVRVFDVGESEAGEPFIVMELLNGESLGDVMDCGPLSATRAVQLLLPIVDALSLAHSRGVVHRDLKPDNIFITVEGGATQPKLLDFGIAKLTDDTRFGSSKLTQAGTLLGSPDYMSPEQARGLPDIDHRSDIWSLCVVLYEALSGRAPFEAPNCPALLRSIVEDVTPPLAALGVDTKLGALVQRGLEKDRDRRYSSMLELGQALAAWLVEQGVQEDVTGSLVAAKWLGRSSPSPSWPNLREMAPNASDAEGGTLESVVHSESRPSSMPDAQRRFPRARRWFPKAAAAMLALAGGALGGGVLASPAIAVGPAPMTTTWTAPAAAAASPVQAPASTLIAAPQLPSDPPANPQVAPPKLDRAPSASRARPTKLASLEQFAPLPASQPASDPKQDLINPYK